MIIISCACKPWGSGQRPARQDREIIAKIEGILRSVVQHGMFQCRVFIGSSPSWLSKKYLLNTTQMPKFGCASRAVSTSALETHTFPSSVLYHSLTGLLREHLPRIIVSLTIVAIKYPALSCYVVRSIHSNLV